MAKFAEGLLASPAELLTHAQLQACIVHLEGKLHGTNGKPGLSWQEHSRLTFLKSERVRRGNAAIAAGDLRVIADDGGELLK